MEKLVLLRIRNNRREQLVKVLVLLFALLLQTTISFAQAPMTCKVKGKILNVLPADKHAKKPCSKYPCKARFLVSQRFDCGSSVPVIINVGDTILVTFPFSMHPARSMAQRIKKGDIIDMNLMEKQYPGGVEFVAVDYHRTDLSAK